MRTLSRVGKVGKVGNSLLTGLAKVGNCQPWPRKLPTPSMQNRRSEGGSSTHIGDLRWAGLATANLCQPSRVGRVGNCPFRAGVR